MKNEKNTASVLQRLSVIVPTLYNHMIADITYIQSVRTYEGHERRTEVLKANVTELNKSIAALIEIRDKAERALSE